MKGKNNTITFRAKVVSGYRITIPELDRKLLGINVGDVVEATIRKLAIK